MNKPSKIATTQIAAAVDGYAFRMQGAESADESVGTTLSRVARRLERKNEGRNAA